MAVRTKCNPFMASSFPAPKFDRSINTNPFPGLFLKPLQLILLLIEIHICNFKLRLRCARLSFKFRYLLFKFSVPFLYERQMESEYGRRSVFVNKLLKWFKKTHKISWWLTSRSPACGVNQRKSRSGTGSAILLCRQRIRRAHGDLLLPPPDLEFLVRLCAFRADINTNRFQVYFALVNKPVRSVMWRARA